MQAYVEHGYNADDMENIFNQAARILRTSQWERVPMYTPDGIRFHEPTCVRAARPWHDREQARYQLHPIVRKALRMSRPDDWQLLLLQWPHESTTDSTRLAYTRDERSGEADRQVVTSIGKYLTAHFSKLPDHAIRDLVALASNSTCKFVHTTAEMIYHLHKGPKSCMVWGDGDMDSHPYKAYCPTLGWHMAIRVFDDDTVGRALCNTDAEGQKYFVRTYKKCPNGGYSNADETLAAWLKAEGYIHYSEYPEGTRLKYIKAHRHSDEFVAPYLDGGNQRVNLKWNNGDVECIVVDEEGDFTCNQTDGTTEESGGVECEDCGVRFDDGDGYWVGRYEDSHICQRCCDNNYVYAYSANSNQRYIHQDNVAYVDSWAEYVDTDYLSDNSVVELANGDYALEDDCVEIDDDWYLNDDERIVCDHEGTYRLIKDCVQLHNDEWAFEGDAWKCYATSDWYLYDDVEPVVIDDNLYHPDDAPEQDAE